MNPGKPPRDNDARAAAEWAARRDRGLTPEEQDAYLHWMLRGRARGSAVADLERTWARLDAMRHWRPAHSADPNPDLLAAPAPRRFSWMYSAVAVAAVVLLTVLGWQARRHDPEHGAQVLPGPERMVLEDGSLVELNAGAKVEVRFSPAERRVRLARGEAHFAVAKNPGRPFVVEVDSYSVRAVGTAFLVQQGQSDVSVTVTEGLVRLGFASAVAGVDATAVDPHVLADLRAGQQAVASRAEVPGVAPAVVVRELTPVEIDAAMPWRGIRLEFDNLPLSEVVKAFNRYNVRQLSLGDPGTAQVRVGGSFRADNLGAFVRLLDTGFDVSAEYRDNEIVLRRR